MNKTDTVNIESAMRNAALEALKEFRKDEREKAKKKSLYNIGLLMEHYLEFMEHYEKIKFRARDLDDEEMENIDIDHDLSVESIKRSKTRTLIIITQVQTAVKMLKADMDSKNESEKYLVIKMLYMDVETKDMRFNQRVQYVADRIKCNEVTVRRWNNEMLNKLAIKLFGIDGLKLDV